MPAARDISPQDLIVSSHLLTHLQGENAFELSPRNLQLRVSWWPLLGSWANYLPSATQQQPPSVAPCSCPHLISQPKAVPASGACLLYLQPCASLSIPLPSCNLAPKHVFLVWITYNLGFLALHPCPDRRGWLPSSPQGCPSPPAWQLMFQISR